MVYYSTTEKAFFKRAGCFVFFIEFKRQGGCAQSKLRKDNRVRGKLYLHAHFMTLSVFLFQDCVAFPYFHFSFVVCCLKRIIVYFFFIGKIQKRTISLHPSLTHEEIGQKECSFTINSQIDLRST